MTRRSALLLAMLGLVGCSAGKACMAACGVRDVYRRQALNELSTTSMLEDVFGALDRYAESCGGYPASLAALEAPPPGTARGCESSGAFADTIRAAGTYREGDSLGMFDFSVSRLSDLRTDWLFREYRFQYVTRDRQDNGTFRSYSLSAEPVDRGVTGFTSYWVSERGDMHTNDSSPASQRDPIRRVLVRTGGPG